MLDVRNSRRTILRSRVVREKEHRIDVGDENEETLGTDKGERRSFCSPLDSRFHREYKGRIEGRGGLKSVKGGP